MREAQPDATLAEIGSALGCSDASVHRVLHRASKLHIEAMLASLGPEAVDAMRLAMWAGAEKGFYQGAERVLTHAKLVDEPKLVLPQSGPNIAVTFAFALPGVPLATPHSDASTHQRPDAPHTTSHTTSLPDIATVAIPAPTQERSSAVGPATLSPAPLPHKANPSD
jgi:hypothetical protein